MLPKKDKYTPEYNYLSKRWNTNMLTCMRVFQNNHLTTAAATTTTILVQLIITSRVDGSMLRFLSTVRRVTASWENRGNLR